MIYKNKIEVYGLEFYVCFDKNGFEKVLKRCRVIEDVNDEYMNGCFIHNNGVMGIYINAEKVKNESDLINTIAHECFHLADYVVDFLSMDFERGRSNEHVAYMVGFASGKVYENYKKWKNKNEK